MNGTKQSPPAAIGKHNNDPHSTLWSERLSGRSLVYFDHESSNDGTETRYHFCPDGSVYLTENHFESNDGPTIRDEGLWIIMDAEDLSAAIRMQWDGGEREQLRLRVDGEDAICVGERRFAISNQNYFYRRRASA